MSDEELYVDPVKEDEDDGKALAYLLQEEVVFPNSIQVGDKWYITLYVVCNDLFAWGMADAEPFDTSDIEAIYKAYEENWMFGVDRWCCIRRNQKPQAAVIELMKEAGFWDDVLEALPPRVTT